jgi:hypothetical protein
MDGKDNYFFNRTNLGEILFRGIMIFISYSNLILLLKQAKRNLPFPPPK